jgi:hypothetical protein
MDSASHQYDHNTPNIHQAPYLRENFWYVCPVSAMNVYMGMEVRFHSFSTSSLDKVSG